MRIYVERLIAAPIERVWEHTQTPELHQRWDLRFTNIEYLHRADNSSPQQFRYATRIGFGLNIEGRGETVGVRESKDSMSSALKFWSDDPKSLIREGAGYWKYTRAGDRTRFLTAYDYEVRFGSIGRAVDAILFRPVMGWATAWSFDRLALWIEKGIEPEESLRRSLVHGISRISIAFVWIYHGLVPKLLFRDAAESMMLQDMGVSVGRSALLVSMAGFAESALGLIVLLAWRQRFVFPLTALLMTAAAVSVGIFSPQYLTSAFNVVSLNVLMISAAAIGWLSSKDLPTSTRCLRKKPEA